MNKKEVKISGLSEFFNQEKEEDVDKFFSDDENIVQVDETEEEEEEKEKKEKKKKEEKKVVIINDDDDEDDEKKEKKGKEEKVINNKDILKILTSKKIISLDIEDEEEIEEDDAIELIREGFEEAVAQNVESIFKNLPKVVKDFNKFVSNGGDPSVFINSFKTTNDKGTLSLKMNLSTEDQQEKVLRALFEEEGLDKDLIDSQIDFLKDSGKLKQLVEKKYQIWSSVKEKEQDNLIEQQERIRENNKEKEKSYRKEISSFISEKDKVGDITLSKQDKRELASYILDKDVMLKNGQTISSFYADLQEVIGKKESLIQLAKILRLRNKAGNFDFTDLKKELETSVTKKVKENIKEGEDPHGSKEKGRNKDLSLVDFLTK